MNKRLLFIGALFGILVVVWVVATAPWQPRIHLAGETLRVMIADTPEARERGLSGRPPLRANEGMLFIFPEEGVYAFWMKDMRFPIDIIWISSLLQVVHIERNVTPETYPKTFSSETPAQYVLEVPAGWTDAHGVEVGDAVGI